MTMNFNKTQTSPRIKTVPCQYAQQDFISKLIKETWYFSRNFNEFPYAIGEEIIYNKRKWKVIKTRKSLQGWAYQLKFISKLSEVEVLNYVFNNKEK